MNKNDLPLGFGMALAQNETAMQQFEALTSKQKEAVVNKTKKRNEKLCQQPFRRLTANLIFPKIKPNRKLKTFYWVWSE